MLGIDISNWQAGIDLSLGKYDFCICKATEGDSHIDKSLDTYLVQLTKLNKLIGVYHYARPDLNTGELGATREAKFFISTIRDKKLIGKAMIFVDWEVENYTSDMNWITRFINEVYTQVKLRPIVYSSESIFNANQELKNYYTWRANWTGIKEMNVSPIKNGEPMQSLLWQYTNVGQYPNYQHSIDLDYTEMSKIEWIMYQTPYNENSGGDANGMYSHTLAKILEELEKINKRLENM